VRALKLPKTKMLPYIPIPTEEEFKEYEEAFRNLFPFKNIEVIVLHEKPRINDGRCSEFSNDEPDSSLVIRISPFMCHIAMGDAFIHEWTHAKLYDEGYRYWYKHTRRFALLKHKIENTAREQE